MAEVGPECIGIEEKFIAPEVLCGGDEEIVEAVTSGEMPSHSLEKQLGDCRRAASIRCGKLFFIIFFCLGRLHLHFIL